MCSQEIIDRIYQILSKVVTNMEMELKQHLFHIIEAPELVSLQDSVQPLFNFLDTRILPYKEFLIRQNFTR
jgi:hypothetical protein